MDIMRRYLYALLVMIVLMSCAGKTSYLIKGRSGDFVDGCKVYLLYLNANEEPIFIDSTVCRNNSFVFRGSADTARVATVAVVDTLEDDSAISINLVLEPGNISIEGFDPETNHFHVATGTPLNDLLDRFSREVGAYVNNPDSLFPFIALIYKGEYGQPCWRFSFRPLSLLHVVADETGSDKLHVDGAEGELCGYQQRNADAN